MDKNLLNKTAQRLNIYDESVIKKAEEYIRLYQSKAAIKSLNDQAKLILCLDLACQALDKNIDKETALALSGFRKSVYQNHINTLEKLLGLDKVLSVSDVCIQLGCMVIKDDAEAILSRYQALDRVKDVVHPQYVAAATYLACKARKISLDKQKLVSLSRLKPTQWKELLSNFEKLGVNKNVVRQQQGDNDSEDADCEPDNPQDSGIREESEEVEEYDAWKKRILAEAYAALNIENQQMEH